ncbi:hypothetical protein G9A89_019264 [Geosiphon pyriformis]|nr:hypothetical protein G9A89_019264 [Geosiphon pyriformis]
MHVTLISYLSDQFFVIAISRSSSNPLLLSPNVIRRSFHTYSPSQTQSTPRTFTSYSPKPQKIFETPSAIRPTNSVPPSIFDIFDKPFSTTRKSLVFSHGASGIPKRQEKLVSNSSDGKYLSIGCGEDSFFRRHDSLGVADGVGGWRHAPPMEHVIADSSLYSRKLMHYALIELDKYDNIDNEKFYHYNDADPLNIMGKSYEQTVRDCALEGFIGSSTALIAVLRGDELRIANLGDCGITIIRHNDIIFRNEEQQHSFNYPYQLGIGPAFDLPTDAQTFTVKIKCGDVVIMGSDGVFDNLFDEDIVEEVRQFTNAAQRGLPIEPQTLSDALAWRAKGVSEDLNNSSPFQCRASQEGMYYQGGKMDDISVLVAVVTDTHDLSGAR